MNRPIVLFFLIFLSPVTFAQEKVYLEEKMAYCHSQNSLAEYLDMANERNLHGMNLLVLAGECDFVADGERLGFSHYRKTTIGNMPVVELESNQRKLWTFQTLLQTNESNQ